MSVLMRNLLRFPINASLQQCLRSQSYDSKLKICRNFSVVSGGSLHHSLLERKCCSCRAACLHTKGGSLLSKSSELADKNSPDIYNTEKELSIFLSEEITAEKSLQKVKNIPSEVDGFSVKLNGSEVVLVKKTGFETIEVCFNINHSVDSESEPEIEPSTDKGEAGEMKSRPDFEVEIWRGDSTLGFTCSMVPPTAQNETQEDVYNDLFTIDEVVMYHGDWKDTNYSVSGSVLDATLYDMFMDMLEDKGINNEFIEKLVGFSTAYEHSCYIKMLEDVQKFCSPSK